MHSSLGLNAKTSNVQLMQLIAVVSGSFTPNLTLSLSHQPWRSYANGVDTMFYSFQNFTAN
jgi:hypothetical protein